MRRLVLTIASACLLAACAVKGEPVPILTGELGCYAGGEGGPTARLLADPRYGATFDGRAVMWPQGYTGRQAGSEVEILDQSGRVRATTGRTYHISFAYRSGVLPGDISEPFPAAIDCGYPWDFVDCTANPANEYCTRP